MDSMHVRTFKLLELEKSYTHKKDRMEMFIFLKLATPSQMRRKEQYASVCVRSIRVHIGFSTNIKNLVPMSELKMSGYNTHDCHTILLFLVIAIRAINHPYVKIVIRHMCHFFNAISNKVIDIIELDEVHNEIQVTMCQLEMCFPPSFFDTMEQHMYPYEHHMVVMKGYVRNRAHPEGSMIEGYTTEEVIECYVDYIKDGKPIVVPVLQHHGRLFGNGTKGHKSFIDVTYKRVCEAHFSIMHQLVVMRPYVEKHLQELRERIQDEEHKLHFTAWLKDLNIHVGETPEEKMIYLLVVGPHSLVKSWQAYDINEFTFYTKANDSRSQCQNSGVKVDAEDNTGQKNAYYGYIEEIWEVNYEMSLQIPLFKCQWVKHPQGVEVDDYGFTIVDLRNVGHKDEPWVLASTVTQVFYILDLQDEKKHIVVPEKQRVIGVDNVEDEKEYNQFDEVSFFVDTTWINIIETKISYSNVISYACTDGEGKLVHV
jgi:hypothetical protein